MNIHPLLLVVSISVLTSGCTASPLKKVPFEERKEMYTVASDYVKSCSVAGLQFSLEPTKKVNSWVIFKVTPRNVKTDSAQIFLQKENGAWKVVDFGTYFPELEESHPELF